MRRRPGLYYFNIRNCRIPLLNGAFIFFIIILPQWRINAQNGSNVFTVVIDAGHGGHDPGAVGSQTEEKKINLAIALRLGNLIQRNLKDVAVIYTRDRDEFVELYRRAEIANRNKADLFISIHCNANKNKTLQGAETYVMGLHKSKANLDIAKLENASILLESDYQSTYGGFDPNSDESYILFNLYQNASLERSMSFAADVQDKISGKVGFQDRGVKQAGFLVLYKTTMPSALVECGYISNSADERFLNSSQGQEFVALAIYRAFKNFAGTTNKTSSQTTTQSAPDSSLNEPVQPVIVKKDEPSKEGKSLEFRIQVATSATELPKSAKIFSEFKSVSMYKHGGLYKYTVGSFRDLPKVKEMLALVKSKGYKDSFIVIFRNNERIPQSEADQIMRN